MDIYQYDENTLSRQYLYSIDLQPSRLRCLVLDKITMIKYVSGTKRVIKERIKAKAKEALISTSSSQLQRSYVNSVKKSLITELYPDEEKLNTIAAITIILIKRPSMAKTLAFEFADSLKIFAKEVAKSQFLTPFVRILLYGPESESTLDYALADTFINATGYSRIATIKRWYRDWNSAFSSDHSGKIVFPSTVNPTLGGSEALWMPLILQILLSYMVEFPCRVDAFESPINLYNVRKLALHCRDLIEKGALNKEREVTIRLDPLSLRYMNLTSGDVCNLLKFILILLPGGAYGSLTGYYGLLDSLHSVPNPKDTALAIAAIGHGREKLISAIFAMLRFICIKSSENHKSIRLGAVFGIILLGESVDKMINSYDLSISNRGIKVGQEIVNDGLTSRNIRTIIQIEATHLVSTFIDQWSDIAKHLRHLY
ncbi:hypothetical protein V1511DRAFT_505864 [Dipodascopsis uninucleata]